MILKKLVLTNYRNYRHIDLDLTPGLNVISGDNAQGKTNFLEAIYYLGTLKSFRVRSESELVTWGEEAAGVSAEFLRPNGTNSQLEVRWARGLKGSWERRARRNGVVLSNLAEFLSEVPLVLFVPQDLALVQGGPELRRRYLNVLLCKSYPAYLYALVRYQKVLKQRNEWWRRRGNSQRWNELEVWDAQMAALASQLVQQRQDAVQKLSAKVGEVFNSLAARPLDLRLRYQASVSGNVEQIIQQLHSRRQDEMHRQMTLLGPHRDDVVLTMNGRSFKQCASQGQHRSAALALRLAEALYMGEVSANPAIVLLDDCFSELDQGRCRRLFDYLGGLGQVIITSVSRLDYQGATAVMEYFVNNGDITCLSADVPFEAGVSQED